jgi:hypothetical protein
VVTFIESFFVRAEVESSLLVLTAPASPALNNHDSYPPTVAPPSRLSTVPVRVYQTSPPAVTLASQERAV